MMLVNSVTRVAIPRILAVMADCTLLGDPRGAILAQNSTAMPRDRVRWYN